MRARFTARAAATLAGLAAIRSGAPRLLQPPVRWWRGLTAAERVLYRGAGLLSAGLALVSPAAALIAAGLVFLAVFFGFDLRRRA